MSIYYHVMDFISAPDAARFEALALKVFRYQFANVTAYRRHCTALGIDAASIARLEDIPPVSTLAFKYTRLAADADVAEEKIFFTSGTTIGGSERGGTSSRIPRSIALRRSLISSTRCFATAVGCASSRCIRRRIECRSHRSRK